MSQQFYVIRKSEDDLEHTHKYVKKYKKNGKWRYVYDIGEGTMIDGYTGKKEPRHQSYTKLQDMLGYDERDAAFRSDFHYRNADKNRKREGTRKELDAEYARISKLGKQASKDMKAYWKTPIGRLNSAKQTIYNGKKKVAKLLMKTAKKLTSNKPHEFWG